MTETIMSSKTAAIRWADVIEYPQTGVKSKTLLEDANCRYTLMLLGVGMQIAGHTNPRNATINVIEGQGILTLEGKELILEWECLFSYLLPHIMPSQQRQILPFY